VADEDDVAQIERGANVEHVLRVAVEAAVAFGAVLTEVGLPRADVIEEDDAVVVLERRGHEAPHVLVAPEAVGEQHGLRAPPRYLHVVPREYVLRHRLPLSKRLPPVRPAAQILLHRAGSRTPAARLV
jgi:hypothetical protein